MRNSEALALGAAVGAGLYLLVPRRANADSAAASDTFSEPALVGTTGSVEYDARATRLVASIPRRIERTRTLISQWSTYLDRYRGGLPRGVFAAAMQMESDGSPSAHGDESLGEAGLFQISESFVRSQGFDPQLRFRNEWNVYFAGTECNVRARTWHQRYPELVGKGSGDAWMLSRLSFAIGDGGAR